jgi:hypothetical protein
MTDSQERQAKNSEASQAIHIEMPTGAVAGMCRVMSKFWRLGTVESGCCEATRDQCCPDSVNENTYQFTVILKRKE